MCASECGPFVRQNAAVMTVIVLPGAGRFLWGLPCRMRQRCGDLDAVAVVSEATVICDLFMVLSQTLCVADLSFQLCVSCLCRL